MKNFIYKLKLTLGRGKKKLKLLPCQYSPIPQNSSVCLSKKSHVYLKMSMKHWFNDTDTEKLNYLEKNVFQFHSVHHNPHGSLPGIEPVPLRRKTDD